MGVLSRNPIGALIERVRVAASDRLDNWRLSRTEWDLPVLREWDEAHRDPASGVWSISPPCGWSTWQLYRPGTGLDEEGFCTSLPAAEFDALTGPGRETAEDPCSRLVDIETWARPWIEDVSEGLVVEMVEGWSSYGPRRSMREYAVFARVEGGR